MIVVIITIQDNHSHYQSPSQSTSFDDNRLGLSLPALGDEDRKNMFAAMDENGDGDNDDHYCAVFRRSNFVAEEFTLV